MSCNLNAKEGELINKFLPLLKNSLKNVSHQDREDYEQEVRELIILKIRMLYKQEVPGFWEFALLKEF